MYRFSIIVALCVGLLCGGGLTAQERRGAGRERGERRVSRVERDGAGHRVPRLSGRAPGAERKVAPRVSKEPRGRGQEQAIVPGRFWRSPQDAHPREPGAPAGAQLARQQGKGYHELFGTVQRGLASGSAAAFSGNLAPQVYVNLRGGESGYYSANQAHYVLENYFKTRRLVNLKFSTIGESEANPYATGSATFVERGTRGLAQVYVSLTRSGERWIITQINIY